MTKHNEHSPDPLGLDAFFTESQVERLESHWITTPQQVLSIGTSDGGKSGLGRLLEMDRAALAEILERLSKQLPVDEVDRLQKNDPGGELGVILPPDTEESGFSREGEG